MNMSGDKLLKRQISKASKDQLFLNLQFKKSDQNKMRPIFNQKIIEMQKKGINQSSNPFFGPIIHKEQYMDKEDLNSHLRSQVID